MLTKVPSPFASPFAKILLAIFWVAYAGMLVALVVERDVALVIIAGGWTIALPWITWSFLSGVRVEPGRSVGGGPMYPRVALEPGETLVFQSPAYADSSGGHLFVTGSRVIFTPVRFGGATRTLRLSDITAAKAESKGIGWPMARQRLRVTIDRGYLTIRPWAGPSFMGMIGADEFIEGLVTALRKAGVTVRDEPA